MNNKLEKYLNGNELNEGILNLLDPKVWKVAISFYATILEGDKQKMQEMVDFVDKKNKLNVLYDMCQKLIKDGKLSMDAQKNVIIMLDMIKENQLQR